MCDHIPAVRRWALAAGLGIVVILAACGGGATPPCVVHSVSVSPSPMTLTVGQSTTLTATVSSSDCAPEPGVTWVSGGPAVSVQGNGTSAQITGMSPTAGPVTVTASANGVSGTSQVTVTLPPSLGLSVTTLNFTAPQGGADPTLQVASISNSGGGTLSGLSTGIITYGVGATGWLPAPTLSATSAPATLTVQPHTGSLAEGSYTATIPVLSNVATNSPQSLTVNFTVTGPTIVLTPSSLSFTAVTGGADPASQFTSITNGGGGTLSGLGAGTITYGAGASDWLLTPVLSSTTAPGTLTLQPVTGSLAPGTYTATVPVLSAGASNSPRTVAVSFTVTPPPAISLSAAALTFAAPEGAGNPAGQVVSITNSGGATLTGLSAGGITYGAGATGWLQAPILSGTTAPASLTVQPVTGALAPGSYTATIPILSGVASNSPQDLAVTFTVSAAMRSVVALVGDNQTGLEGFAVNVRPAVQVTDGGIPIPNLDVTFTVQSGGGSVVGGATVTTNTAGVAQVGDWVLGGGPGTNTLTATVAAAGVTGDPVMFTAVAVGSTFNITVQNVGPAFSGPVQAAFDAATTKWQQIIYRDISDIPGFAAGAGQCGTGSPAIGPVNVDDVLILARIDSIDGPGKILGQAGPCFIRFTGGLTVMGAMIFDSADVAGLVSRGSLDAVILHEMGHVLGFGSLWSQPQFSCLGSPSNPPGTILDTYFACPRARSMFDSLGGTSYTGGNKVPVENCGPASPIGCGLGTANGHWREPTFDDELMTGYIRSGVPNPLSRLTAAAMEDLGYTVNYAGTDNYLHSFSLVAGAPRRGQLDLGDDRRRGPIYVVSPGGRVVGTIQPR